jgi:superfamily II DNA or RNA helicase
MNISIKNINNCEKLDSDKIVDIAEKLNIKIQSDLDYSDNYSKSKLCKIIKNKVNEINPCAISLYSDTDLSIKKHQLNVANHLVNNRGIIVVHSVGTGKTLSAISTGQCLLIKKLIKHIVVITPTSLQQNFISQAKMYGLSNEELDTHYTFYTIQGIANAIESNNISSPSNSLVIIDEAHNLRTINGSRFDLINKYIKKASKIMLLTGTPLINYKHDIINLVSLINGEKPISIDKFENMVVSNNQKELKKYLSNIFSFYIKDSEKPDPNFPNKKILDIFLRMGKDYLKTYLGVEHGQVGKIPDFKGKNISVFYNGLRRASNIIDKKSPKVDWIIGKIKSEPKEKFVIFSHFINMGIKPIMSWLTKKNIPWAHVTGDLSMNDRQSAVEKYNSGKVKILFISSAGSEGLDLKGTNNIIIMEPQWNENSIEQIIGRGVRYKSHEGLPKSKQTVTVFRLYSIKPEEYKSLDKITKDNLLDFNGSMLSVDLYLKNYSWLKQQEIISFYKLLHKYKIH